MLFPSRVHRLPRMLLLGALCLLSCMHAVQSERLLGALYPAFHLASPSLSSLGSIPLHYNVCCTLANAAGVSPYPCMQEVERRWVDYYAKHSDEFSPALPPTYGDIRHKEGENELCPQGKKFYILSMIPYPSNRGLHMGHCYTYTLSDVAARYHRLRLRANMQTQQLTNASASIPPSIPYEQEKERPMQPNVLHVMGWDSFGLPAEQHARERGEPPDAVVHANIYTFKLQLQRLGISVDWRREITTSDPTFYRWTQWAFLQMLRRGLAYEKDSLVNWCPSLGTVLANEELTAEGLSERGRFPVERRRLRQWHLRLRAYADRLLSGLSSLNWPSDIIQMQRKWIGKMVYNRLWLKVAGGEGALLPCLLLKPEYISTCTGVVLHPRHPFASGLRGAKEGEKEEVRRYIRSRGEGWLGYKRIKGVRSGVYVHHPVTNVLMPVLVSDIMEELPEFGLQLKESDALLVSPIQQPLAASLVAAGLLSPAIQKVNRVSVDGLEEQVLRASDSVRTDASASDLALERDEKERVERWLTEKGISETVTRYRLKDWVFSRQRYWGEPIPVLRVCPRGDNSIGVDPSKDEHGSTDVEGETGMIWPLPENELPLTLPPFLPDEPLISTPAETSDLSCARDTGSTSSVNKKQTHRPNRNDVVAALRRYKDWVLPRNPPYIDTKTLKGPQRAPSGGPQVCRETCTMPQWAGSSWYHLRFPDPHNESALARLSLLKYWLPVDLYVGGKEHAVTHLIYARFWHKVLADIGAAPYEEPFQCLVTPGVILGSPRHFLLRRTDTDTAVSAAETDLYPTAIASLTPSTAHTHTNQSARAASVCGIHRPSGIAVYADPIPPNSPHVSQTNTGTWVFSPPHQTYGQSRIATATLHAGIPSQTATDAAPIPTATAPNAAPAAKATEAAEAATRATEAAAKEAAEAAEVGTAEETTGATEAAAGAEAAEIACKAYEAPLQVVTVREKMSKSRGNAVSPDSVLKTHGADVLRIHLMALGPVAATKVWREDGLAGASRLLRRIWNMLVSPSTASPMPSRGLQVGAPGSPGGVRTLGLGGVEARQLSEGEKRVLSPLVQKVTQSFERMQVNRAVASLMLGSRQLQHQQQQQGGTLSVTAASVLLTLLHPLAPFLTEELWSRLTLEHASHFPYPGWSLAASGEWPEMYTQGCNLEGAGIGGGEVPVSIHIDGRRKLAVMVDGVERHAPEDLADAVKRAPEVQQRLQREALKGRVLSKVISKPAARLVNFVFT